MDPTNKIVEKQSKDDGEGQSQDNRCSGSIELNQPRWGQKEEWLRR